MERVKVLIVENQWSTAEDLVMKVKKLGFLSMGYVKSGEAAIEKCKQEVPDIVFMDIHLDEQLSGIETVKILNTLHDIAFIFLTDFEDKTIFKEALKTGPANYISKPISLSDLERSIYLALDQKGKQKYYDLSPSKKEEFDFVYVKDTEGIKTKLFLDSILFIEASGPYSYIHFLLNGKIKKHIVSDNSTSVSSQLPSFFKRIHRSYVVNMKKIDSIQGKTLSIMGKKIPIGDKYKNTITLFTIIK